MCVDRKISLLEFVNKNNPMETATDVYEKVTSATFKHSIDI